MKRLRLTLFFALFLALFQTPPIHAQSTPPIDFARDVQPIFREHCLECHGPTQQMGGFRLDRRKEAFLGGSIAVIARGSNSGSRMFHKLTSETYGTRMPPAGPLSAEKIDVLRRWLDEGAVWPDELSGELPPLPVDPAALAVTNAIRNADAPKLKNALAKLEKIDARSEGGATALMFAALYGDAKLLAELLAKGANPNSRNDAGATSLMWAAADLKKVQLLVNAGADLNIRSKDGHTALSVAAGRYRSAETIKYLLGKGAKTSASQSQPILRSFVLGEAPAIAALLNASNRPGLGLAAAVRNKCAECLQLLLPFAQQADKNNALRIAALSADLNQFQSLKALGATMPPTNGPAREAIPHIVQLASNEFATPEMLEALLSSGEKIDARSPNGETALDWASKHGETKAVAFLRERNAPTLATPPTVPAQQSPAPDLKTALSRALPLLARAEEIVLRQSGCVTCHHNSLGAMTQELAEQKGLAADKQAAERQRTTLRAYFAGWKERALQSVGIPGASDTISYLLLGARAAKLPPDLSTDALAYYLLGQQRSDGSWKILPPTRPPIESSDIEVTAVSMRSLQTYAPPSLAPQFQHATQAAAKWLGKATPRTNEDKSFQLLGLSWAGASSKDLQNMATALIAEQRADGGWAQLPTLSSDAYATGQAMYALRESGTISAKSPAYKKAVQYLLRTQLADGSWYVRSRSVPFQPYMETGFPHGKDQWISAAASNWAAMGLLRALD